MRNLDRMVEHPTEPDGLPPSMASAGQDPTVPSAGALNDGDLNLDAWDANFGANAPFDSLGWALDGFLDLPLGSNDQSFV